MTSVGGAGGAGGSGPIGPGGPVDGPEGVGPAEGTEPVSDAAPVSTARVDQLAADLDAGKITPEQAMAALIDESVAGLPPAEQAEVRRLMEDVVAADPYLGGLLGST